MPHRILSLNELAEYLHLPQQDILLLVKRHEIPHRQRGKDYVFQRIEIDRWASQRLLGMKDEDIQAFHRSSTAKEHDLSERHALLPELLQPNHIAPDLEGKTPPKIIRNMVDLADRTGMVWDRGGLLAGVEEREALCSTALPCGVALLHPPHHEPYMFEDSFIVYGRSRQPVLYGAPGGGATEHFFLLCAQEDRIHLHLLARVSMVFRATNVLEQLHHAESAGDMFDALAAAEQELIDRHSPV